MDGPRIHTIPGDLSFADVLAAGLWHRADHDPERLSHGIVLVPHRRAARVLSDAFLRLGEGRAMLLPEIRAVGDVVVPRPDGASEAPRLIIGGDGEAQKKATATPLRSLRD